jgi:glycerophosphoryl diester phosphodiesterase
VKLVISEIKKFDILDRFIIRSFDYAPLQYIRGKYPKIPLCLIVEDSASTEEHLKLLGFTPFMYSPDFNLVNSEMIAILHALDVKCVPWTVNEVEDMKRLNALGVDGLISDYPNRFQDLVG